eukprot:scaffold738_cov219-Pinguiococcus_pyrenoidosus.AAC.1
MQPSRASQYATQCCTLRTPSMTAIGSASDDMSTFLASKKSLANKAASQPASPWQLASMVQGSSDA